jgi:2-alkyl-3-oxoalkanoate reductase
LPIQPPFGRGSSVLVTGGSGFVGTAVVRRLLRMGCRVRVISRLPHDALQAELIRECNSPDALDWRAVDLGGIADLAPHFADVELAVHIAALVDSAASPAAFNIANVVATRNVCEAALKGGVGKLVHISTSDVFGLPQPGEVISERTPYRPWGESYPDTKIKAAEIVHSYRERGLASVILHLGWVYGPGDRAFFPALIRQIRNRLVPVWAPPGFAIHLVFVEDVVDAIVRATAESIVNDDFLILDSDSGVEWSDLCARIAMELGVKCHFVHVPYFAMHAIALTSCGIARLGLARRPLLTPTDVKSFGRHFRYVNAKAGTVLGWGPKTPFDLGVRNAVAWQLTQSGSRQKKRSVQ